MRHYLESLFVSYRIEIHFNINHTVDNEETEVGLDPSMDKPEFGELKSKPTFDVDIKRGTTTLSFTCSFFGAQPESQGGQDDDGLSESLLPSVLFFQCLRDRTLEKPSNFVPFIFVSDDIFGIDEITLFDGEWDDKHYTVAGEILDGVCNSFLYLPS